MKHRHIETDDDVLTVAAAMSVLERGSDQDVKEMMRALKADPFSRSADNALEAAEAAGVYGLCPMVIECISRWRNGIAPGP